MLIVGERARTSLDVAIQFFTIMTYVGGAVVLATIAAGLLLTGSAQIFVLVFGIGTGLALILLGVRERRRGTSRLNEMIERYNERHGKPPP